MPTESKFKSSLDDLKANREGVAYASVSDEGWDSGMGDKYGSDKHSSETAEISESRQESAGFATY